MTPLHKPVRREVMARKRKHRLSKVTFHNVTVTVEAPSSVEAYNRLCALLSPEGAHDVEFRTDTFANPETGENGDTMVLWPAWPKRKKGT